MISKERIAKLTAAMLLDRAKLHLACGKSIMPVLVEDLISVLEWAQAVHRRNEELNDNRFNH